MYKLIIVAAALVINSCSGNPVAASGTHDIDMSTVSVSITDTVTIYAVPVDPGLSVVNIELYESGGWHCLDNYGGDDISIGISEDHTIMYLYNYTDSEIVKIRVTQKNRVRE